MNDKTFFKYFKKSSRSSSPKKKNNLNELLGYPFKQEWKTKTHRSQSPEQLPNISPKNMETNLSKLETNPEILTTKRKENINMLFLTNQAEISNTNSNIKTKKQFFLKKDENIIKKYKEIREECLENQIKFIHIRNKLIEEEKMNPQSLDALSFSLEILETINTKIYFQIENPLNIVISTLKNFLFMKRDENIENIRQIIGLKSWEIKKIPLLSIINDICKEFSKRNTKIHDLSKEKDVKIELLCKNLDDLKMENEKIMEDFHKKKKEEAIIKEKEFESFKSKVIFFSNSHLINLDHPK